MKLYGVIIMGYAKSPEMACACAVEKQISMLNFSRQMFHRESGNILNGLLYKCKLLVKNNVRNWLTSLQKADYAKSGKHILNTL